MHNYNVPAPSTLDEPELLKLRSLTDQFNDIAQKNFSDPKHMRRLAVTATREEAGTVQGMFALIGGSDGKDNPVHLAISLQIADLSTSVLDRVDSALLQSCVPTGMGQEDIADLFKKYDLPTLEKLSRKAIKPPSP